MRIRVYDDATRQGDRDGQEPRLDRARRARGVPLRSGRPIRAGSTYARPAGDEQQRRSSCSTRRPAKLHQATTGYLNDTQPVFDPEGKYLFYASDRAFDPVYGTFDNTLDLRRTRRSMVAVPLRKDVKSPLAARNDAENAGAVDNRQEAEDEAGRRRPDDESRTTEQSRPRAGQRRHRSRRLRGARRGAAAEGRQLRRPAGGQGQAALPPPAARRLAATRRARSSTSISTSARRRRSSTTPTAFEVTFDGKKMLVVEQEEVRDRRGEGGAEVREADATSATSRCRSIRAPSGGRSSSTRSGSSATSSTTRTCTASTGRRCASATRRCSTTRSRAGTSTSCIGEFIGELNASHTYHGGGDDEQAPQRSVGMLGVDWELANGAYRIKRIVRGGPWDAGVAVAARRAGRQRQGGRLRARGQRRAARHRRPIRGRASRALGEQDRRAHRERARRR